MQLSDEELKADAERIFTLILQDPDFKETMGEIKHTDVVSIVNEALHVLYHSPDPEDFDTPYQIYNDSCLVISVLLHWLVSYLYKQLMQLLTPEALVVHSEHIPLFYLQTYLKFQEHFSLKELVQKHFDTLERNNW